jgi:hypothetical protein
LIALGYFLLFLLVQIVVNRFSDFFLLVGDNRSLANGNQTQPISVEIPLTNRYAAKNQIRHESEFLIQSLLVATFEIAFRQLSLVIHLGDRPSR